jgi:hypothetical protein
MERKQKLEFFCLGEFFQDGLVLVSRAKSLLIELSSTRLAWKYLPRTITLAYYSSSINDEESLKTLTCGVNVFKKNFITEGGPQIR